MSLVSVSRTSRACVSQSKNLPSNAMRPDAPIMGREQLQEEIIRKLRDENAVLGRAIEQLLETKQLHEFDIRRTYNKRSGDPAPLSPEGSLLLENKLLKQRLASWKERALEESRLVDELRKIAEIIPDSDTYVCSGQCCWRNAGKGCCWSSAVEGSSSNSLVGKKNNNKTKTKEQHIVRHVI